MDKQGQEMRIRKEYILLVIVLLGAASIFFISHSSKQVVSCDVKKEVTTAVPSEHTLSESSGPPAKVIVFAYWRSGSSIIGELFNQNNDAFYMFEPTNGFFFPVNHSSNSVRRKADGKIVHTQDTVFTYDRVQHDADELSRFMQNVLECDLEKVPDPVFAYRYMKKSRALYEFNFCMDFDPALVPHCRHLLQPVCRSARLRALKDVWISMTAVDKLLQRDPSYKIVHLVRDPRAIVLSMYKAFWDEEGDETRIVREVQNICKSMVNDFQAKRYTQENFPENFLEVLYEDFAEQPIKVAKDIYKFVGQSLPSEVEKWVRKSTNSQTDPKESSFQTVRKNSTATAYHWKEVAEFETIHKIDLLPECQQAYKLLGYRAVKDKYELRNNAVIHRVRHR